MDSPLLTREIFPWGGGGEGACPLNSLSEASFFSWPASAQIQEEFIWRFTRIVYFLEFSVCTFKKINSYAKYREAQTNDSI